MSFAHSAEVVKLQKQVKELEVENAALIRERNILYVFIKGVGDNCEKVCKIAPPQEQKG